ncbi:MAG: hypothetical protein JXB49_32100 [Bacteroidales bacterium]|nr:hypothetical protein [Bacteroidales bacterium]
MRISQQEYNRILDAENATEKGLSQTECMDILIKNGYTYNQANNGSYVYIHHRNCLTSKRRGTKEEYARILDSIRAHEKNPKECIAHLESVGFSYRQAQTAVYNYRKERHLIGKKYLP